MDVYASEKNKFFYRNVPIFQQQQYYKILVAFTVFCGCHIVKGWAGPVLQYILNIIIVAGSADADTDARQLRFADVDVDADPTLWMQSRRRKCGPKIPGSARL